MNTTESVGLLLGLLLTASAGAETVEVPFALFNVHIKAGACPAGIQGKDGCLFVTGEEDDPANFWTTLDRVDVPGDGPQDVPAGCNPATTTGALKSKEGLLHFKGAGYYCPNSNSAIYQIEFDDKDAEQFNIPTTIGEFMFHGKTANRPATEIYIALVRKLNDLPKF